MRIPLFKLSLLFVLLLFSLESTALKPAGLVQGVEKMEEQKQNERRKKIKKKQRIKKRLAKVGTAIKDNQSLLFLSVFNLLSGLVILILFSNVLVLVILGAALMVAGFVQSISAFRRRKKSDFLHKFWFFILSLPIMILMLVVLISLVSLLLFGF